MPPIVVENNRYPIGILDDIELHFMHYKTFEEAAKHWQKE